MTRPDLYSYRNASIGSSLDTVSAARTPPINPTA
jgi:hypothetical protein